MFTVLACFVSGRIARDDVVDERGDQHQDHQREADAEQRDEGEELAPQEHLPGERQIALDHGSLVTRHSSFFT
jgi:succinate dehydrogenase/fumarate reductase flavoprotein subunit